jgi:hypothetical protein
MIKNNKFFIPNIKNIIFFGETAILKSLIKINELLKIKTLLITTISQSKNISYTPHNKYSAFVPHQIYQDSFHVTCLEFFCWIDS